MFFIGAGILIGTNTVFMIFGTDKEQPWNQLGKKKMDELALETDQQKPSENDDNHSKDD